MRNSSIFLLGLTGEAILPSLRLMHVSISENALQAILEQKAALVKTLRPTDLCLFTAIRYTRHLFQADLNTAFQEHPLLLEYIPSGPFHLAQYPKRNPMTALIEKQSYVTVLY